MATCFHATQPTDARGLQCLICSQLVTSPGLETKEAPVWRGPHLRPAPVELPGLMDVLVTRTELEARLAALEARIKELECLALGDR